MLNRMPKIPTRRDEAAWALIEELRCYAADSVNSGLPEPILPGHPAHRKMEAYQKSYPLQPKVPAACRITWKKLLRLSRAKDPKAFDAADEFLEWLENQHPLDEEDVPPEDGPDPLFPRFGHNGKSIRLSFKQWTVLTRAWPKKKASIDDVCVAAWENGLPSQNALKQVLKRINAIFEKKRVPFRVSQDKGEIQIL